MWVQRTSATSSRSLESRPRAARGATIPSSGDQMASVGGGEGEKSYPGYIGRILTHAVDVLEGRTSPLVYPPVSSLPDR